MVDVCPTDAELDQALLEHLANLSAMIDVNHHLEDSLSKLPQ